MQVAQAEFAFNILEAAALNESIVLSPISISFALGMALVGAKGTTASEIQNAIARGMDIKEIHNHCKTQNGFLRNFNSSINVVNKGYCAENANLLDKFVDEIQEYYDGSFSLMDFTANENSAKEINKFVDDSTNGKIQDIVMPEIFDKFTSLVLINAIKFDFKWEKSFELKSVKLPFYSSPTCIKEVFMMEQNTCCQYYVIQEKKCVIVEIPYKDNAFDMFIVLPKENYGLSEVIQKIDASEMLFFISGSRRLNGKIIIPKFEIDTSLNLTMVLKKLNIIKAFNQWDAEFTGISNTQLFISCLLHKASINVNEAGTIAAAATVDQIEYRSTIPVTPFEFIADHPFLYFITDRVKNILFMGTFCG